MKKNMTNIKKKKREKDQKKKKTTNIETKQLTQQKRQITITKQEKLQLRIVK